MSEEEIIINEKGGKQHKVEGRFDLLPPFALDRIAKILETGAAKYGDWNWTKIPAQDHLNHAINHLFKLVAGDTSEDHAGNAGCRILFLLDMLYRESASAPGMTDLMVPPETIDLEPNTEKVGWIGTDEDTFPVDKNTGKVYENVEAKICGYKNCRLSSLHVGNHQFL